MRQQLPSSVFVSIPPPQFMLTIMTESDSKVLKYIATNSGLDIHAYAYLCTQHPHRHAFTMLALCAHASKA